MKKVFITILAIGFSLPICAQEIGLQLYSLRNQFKTNIEGTLKTISDWGIDKVEGGDTYGMDEAEFRALLGQYNINVVGIGVDYNDLKKDLSAIADKADRYGAKYLMCPWIPHKGDDFTLEDTQQAIELFNKAGAYFKTRGLIFTYHMHGYEFRPHGDGTLFDLMASQATDFDFEMDVYWVKHGGEDAMELFNRYPDKFKLMHLKDMAKGVEGNDSGHEDVETNVALGSGQVDIAGLVKRAKELGIEYMFIEDESSRVLDQVPQSLEFLKGL